MVAKTANQDKFTIWTAPASPPNVPVLEQLNMRALLGDASSAKKRAARTRARLKATLAFYVSRPSTESLRKTVSSSLCIGRPYLPTRREISSSPRQA
jgi:hypothetical protein